MVVEPLLDLEELDIQDDVKEDLEVAPGTVNSYCSRNEVMVVNRIS